MKKLFSIVISLSVILFIPVWLFPLNASALPNAHNGTMTSAQTVYCLPGGGMTIGSVSNHESVQVYWKEGSYYYIQYVVSSGNYSGYKRGYVPVSSVSVSGVGENTFSSYHGKVTSNKTVYNRSDLSSLVIGSVYSSDTFDILQEDGLWYYIDYPISGGGHKRGYIQRSDIVQPQGTLEAVSFSRIVGWAFDPVNEDRIIQVHIYIKNNATGEEHGYAMFADIYRPDLASAGYGNGYHGFEYEIDWTGYSPGTYTIRAYAINGINPQFASSTYYTPYRYADYYFTARNWPDSVDTNIMNAINEIQSDYQSFGLVPYYTDSVTAETAVNALQTNFITTLHGHGSAGQICLRVSETTTQWLHSTFTPNGSDRAIKDIPANSMTQADIVAFLSCNSSVTPSGNNHKSLTQIVLDKGAKVSIGFSGSVSGAEFWYEYFVDGLTQNMNCAEAYEYANYCAADDYACGNSVSLAEIFRRCMI